MPPRLPFCLRKLGQEVEQIMPEYWVAGIAAILWMTPAKLIEMRVADCI